MTFEEWWEKEVDAWDTGVKTIAEEAWQQGYNKGYSVGFDESEVVFEAGVKEGIQEGIERMRKYPVHEPNCDIERYSAFECPECTCSNGRGR